MMANSRVELALNGDIEVLTELLEDHGPAVEASIARRIPAKWRSLLSSEDVMQQTYADAFRSISSFTPLGDGAFEAWLASLANANLRDAIRMLEAQKRGGGKKPLTPQDYGDSCLNLLEQVSESATTPSGQFSRDELIAGMLAAIETLPHDYSTVIKLFDLDGCESSRVAQALGRSVGAVHMLHARALDRLREKTRHMSADSA